MGGLVAFEYADMQEKTCPMCGIAYAVPRPWNETKRDDHADFYCPNGCRLHYPGESDLEREKRLRNQAERGEAWQRSRRESAEKSAAAYKGHITRIKRRVGNGVCPCCNRTFKNLADHMETKHPEYSD